MYIYSDLTDGGDEEDDEKGVEDRPDLQHSRQKRASAANHQEIKLRRG